MRAWLAASVVVLAFVAGCGSRTSRAPRAEDAAPQALAPEVFIAGVDLSPSGAWAVVRTGKGMPMATRLRSGTSRWTHRGEEGPTWLVDLARGQARRLKIEACLDPWSPDGRRLSFVVGGEAWSVEARETMPRTSAPTGLGVYDVATGASRVVVPPAVKRPWNYGLPASSPDGRRLAFTASYFDVSTRPPTTKPSQLLTVPADGSAPPRVEAESVGLWWWSADGKHLLCYRDAHPPEAMTRIGGKATRLVLPPLTFEGPRARVVHLEGFSPQFGRPRWSPDRRVLALQGYPARTPGDDRPHPRLLLADTRLRPLVTAPTAPGPDSSPVWSPDGRRALFVVSHGWDVQDGLYAIDLATKTIALVQNPALEGTTPVGWIRWGGKLQLLAIDAHEERLLLAEDLEGPVYTLAHVQDDGSLAFDLRPPTGGG